MTFNDHVRPGPPDPAWNDAAYAGCKAWLGGWRQIHGSDVPPPPMAVARSIGDTAVSLMRQGVPRSDLVRLMWAAGQDGLAVDPAMLEVDG